MPSTDIVVLRSYWHSLSSRTHAAVCPAVGALSLFCQGLTQLTVLFLDCCVVGALPCVVHAASVLFVVIMSLGPRCVMSSTILLFSFLSLVPRLHAVRAFWFIWTVPCTRCLSSNSLPPLRSYSCRCGVLGQVACLICAIPVPLGAWLVLALEGLFIIPIYRSTIRCARSVRSWVPTQALIIGAQVDILWNILVTYVDADRHWQQKQMFWRF